MGTPAEFQIARARNVDCNPGNITAPASLSRAISAVNLASSYRFTRRLRGPTGDSLRRAALAPPTRSYMHNFFKPVATSAGGEPAPKRSRPSVPTWKAVHESMLVRDDPGCRPNHRIAAFDLDDTLQKTRSGKPGYMVTDLGDFVPWNARVPSKLRALHDAGYKVVIFSNQGGVKGAMEGKRADVVRARLDAFAKEVGIPVQALCATQKGEKDPKNYRKPKSGMWAHFDSSLNGSVSPDLPACFYVGDAAGREGDHSDSDKGFAVAVGVKFFTPDEFFADDDLPDFVTESAEKKKGDAKEEIGGAKGGGGVIVIDDDSE